MRADAVLITTPAIDFSTLIGLSYQALGYSPSATADASPFPLSDTERYLACLGAMKDKDAPVTLPPHLLAHVSFSVLVAAQKEDIYDLLEICSGMPFMQTDTLARNVQFAVVTGTLAQWREAVIAGCQPEVLESVRMLCTTILHRFETARLRVWDDCNRKQAGHALLLDDKRDRTK